MHYTGEFRPEVYQEEGGDKCEESKDLDKSGVFHEILLCKTVEIYKVKGPGYKRPGFLPIP